MTAPPATAPVVDVADLRMRYGRTDVLLGVDLTVHRGEVVALLGPNGAGKTTTIEILEGFRAPSSGRVRVLGADPLHAGDDWRSRVGVVLQSWRDHGKWTPRTLLDHLRSCYQPHALPGREPHATAALLDHVGLTAVADRQIRRLSGGQRRRLDLAAGIVGRPELLFLDEPTAGFDPVARRDFHDLVHDLTDTEDVTVLLTTHDLDEAEKLADRVLILDRGRIVADDSADRLARRTDGLAEVRWTEGGARHVHAAADATAFVRELLARPGITDLEVRRASLEDTYLAVVADPDPPAGPTGPTTPEARR